MLTTIEAEIDVDGKITLLEPLKVSKKSRVIITLLEELKQPRERNKSDEKKLKADQSEYSRQMKWLKANQAKYGGQYIILDGDKLLGTAKDFRAAREIANNLDIPHIFVTYLSKPDEVGYTGGWD